MSVLVQCHLTPLPQREVRVPDPLLLGITGNPAAVYRILIEGYEFHLEEDRGIRLGRLAGGVEKREPTGDELAVNKVLSGELSRADELGAEKVIILNLELELADGMRYWDNEVLVPVRVLGVLNDTRPRESGLWHDDGYVGVAGDDLGMTMTIPLPLPIGINRL